MSDAQRRAKKRKFQIGDRVICFRGWHEGHSGVVVGYHDEYYEVLGANGWNRAIYTRNLRREEGGKT